MNSIMNANARQAPSGAFFIAGIISKENFGLEQSRQIRQTKFR